MRTIFIRSTVDRLDEKGPLASFIQDLFPECVVRVVLDEGEAAIEPAENQVLGLDSRAGPVR